VGLNPGFTSKLNGKDGPLDGRKITKNNKESQMGQVTPKNIFKRPLRPLSPPYFKNVFFERPPPTIIFRC